MTTPRHSAALLVAFTLGGALADAEVLAKRSTVAGLTVSYRVVLPKAFDASRTYPAVLAFAGGRQDAGTVDDQLQKHWIAEAERRGYVVVSPEAPDGLLFFAGGDRIFPSFLDLLLREYRIEGRKFHIAGRSNGGLSAFHIASRYPRYFRSVTVFPGLLPHEDEGRMGALQSLPIHMHVGSDDSEWRPVMQRQYELFRKKGLRVSLTVEKGLGHALEASLGGDGARRLFDDLEE